MKRIGFIITVLFFLQVAAFSDVSVAPVPWIPEDGKPKTGTLDGGISFKDVPANSEIFIYTITGGQARRIECNNSAPATKKWDGKNDNGQYVASGVYLWVVKSSDRTQKGKLIVVR